MTPLRSHLQKLFVDFYTKSGAIKLLSENIEYAQTRPPSELAIRVSKITLPLSVKNKCRLFQPKINLPGESALSTIKQYLARLQAADSPLEKLEYLLAAISTIFAAVKSTQAAGSNGKSIMLGADDFLPLFVWVLVKSNFVTAEIEAEYMWGEYSILSPDNTVSK